MKRFLPAFFLFAAAVSPAGHLSAAGRPLRVSAGFSILGDWAKAVGGDDAAVSVLVGPGGDPHVYEPTPADGRALAGADLVVALGAGFEPWLDRLLRASGKEALRVADGMPLRQAGGETDPHVWGDPLLALRAVESLRDAFSRADPARTEAYGRRAAAYAEELRALDVWTRELTARVPENERLLVATHDTLGYWAARYGFKAEPGILGSFSTEAADPSAARLARLADRLKASGAKAIFVETAGDGGLAEAVARAAGIERLPRLYTDSLDRPGGPADTYLKMMRFNARTIVDALSPAGNKP